MDMIPLKPERKAQLDEYAKRRGQDPVAALDEHVVWNDRAKRQAAAHGGYRLDPVTQIDLRLAQTRP